VHAMAAIDECGVGHGGEAEWGGTAVDGRVAKRSVGGAAHDGCTHGEMDATTRKSGATRHRIGARTRRWPRQRCGLGRADDRTVP
jgi:hypothetical protein